MNCHASIRKFSIQWIFFPLWELELMVTYFMIQNSNVQWYMKWTLTELFGPLFLYKVGTQSYFWANFLVLKHRLNLLKRHRRKGKRYTSPVPQIHIASLCCSRLDWQWRPGELCGAPLPFKPAHHSRGEVGWWVEGLHFTQIHTDQSNICCIGMSEKKCDFLM